MERKYGKKQEVRHLSKGKEIEELAQEVYEQKVQEEAKKYHIDLYGKYLYQVLREINEQKVLQMADELNMDKMNMNIQELAEKIKRAA